MPDDVEALEIESTPTPDDVQFLDDRLYEFNVAATGIDNGRLLGIFVRDASGTITAGLSGWTWGDCCRVEELWVGEDLRGGGVGSRAGGCAGAGWRGVGGGWGGACGGMGRWWGREDRRGGGLGRRFVVAAEREAAH